MHDVRTMLRRVRCTKCDRKATLVAQARALAAYDGLQTWRCPDESCGQTNHILSGELTMVWAGHGSDPNE